MCLIKNDSGQKNTPQKFHLCLKNVNIYNITPVNWLKNIKRENGLVKRFKDGY